MIRLFVTDERAESKRGRTVITRVTFAFHLSTHVFIVLVVVLVTVIVHELHTILGCFEFIFLARLFRASMASRSTMKQERFGASQFDYFRLEFPELEIGLHADKHAVVLNWKPKENK